MAQAVLKHHIPPLHRTSVQSKSEIPRSFPKIKGEGSWELSYLRINKA